MAATLLTGCGGGGRASSGGASTDQRSAVVQAVKRFEQAATAHDGSTYCAMLTPQEQGRVMAVVSQFFGPMGSCQMTMHAVLHAFTSDRTAKNVAVGVSGVTIKGDQATVVLPSDGKQLQLQQVGGSWRISGVPGEDLAG